MAKGNNPLNRQHLGMLNKLLASCAETREFLKKCSAANIDVDKEVQENDTQEKMAAELKRQFFPQEK